MRKGIKKWRSKVVKANDISKRLSKALEANSVMEDFIKNIYYSARNCRPLTITLESSEHLMFLIYEVGLDFKIQHGRDDIELMSPTEVEMRAQEERLHDSKFGFKCY